MKKCTQNNFMGNHYTYMYIWVGCNFLKTLSWHPLILQPYLKLCSTMHFDAFSALHCYSKDLDERVQMLQTASNRAHLQQLTAWVVDNSQNFIDWIRAPSSKKWNFRTQFLENFRTISGHFCQFHKAQDTEKPHFYVLINTIHWSRSVLQFKKCY